MSATKRGGIRSEADYYPTPTWCVERLLESVTLYGSRWLDPCAGDGAILRAAAPWTCGAVWGAIEIRPACGPPLERLVGHENVCLGDVLQCGPWARSWRPDVIITNPPYRIAQQVLDWSLSHAPTVAMLLRLGFLGSARRCGFMREMPPDVYVLPDRPSFTGDGRGDSADYGWFVWSGCRGRRAGTLQVLKSTPRAVRRPRVVVP